jgi:hypothetical protein
MSRTITYWLGILGALFFVVPAILGGFQFEEYSHISQFLSETYAVDAPYNNQLRFFGYLPSGIMLTLFAFFAPKYLPKSKLIKISFWLFAIFYGLGTVMVAIFNCDAGCNRELIDPSISQIIHNLSGGLTYLVVPFVVITIGVKARSWTNSRSYATTTLVCGVIALIFAWLMMANPNGPFIGLYQRLVEGALLFWVVRTAVFIKNENK